MIIIALVRFRLLWTYTLYQSKQVSGRKAIPYRCIAIMYSSYNHVNIGVHNNHFYFLLLVQIVR